MSDLTKDEYLQTLLGIYFRSVDPGWEKLKTFLNIGEKGGFWMGKESYVYYPGKEPETFSLTWYDEDGEMLEVDSGDLFMQLWKISNDGDNKWYSATLTIYPDKKFEFLPSFDGEKTFAEVQALQYIP